MSFKEYRYLKKYVGKYRVLPRYDIDTEDWPRDENGKIDESFDDLYIKCKKGEIRHTYKRCKGDVILCWYIDSIKKGNNVYNEIKEKFPEVWIEKDEDLKDCSFDYIFYFYETDIEKIGSIVGISDYGAKVPIFSTKNLPKNPYTIPDKDIAKLNKLLKDKDHTFKMQFIRKCCIEFDDILIEKFSTKKTEFSPKNERSKSKLKVKEFIHKMGCWDEFIQFCTQQLNQPGQEAES